MGALPARCFERRTVELAIDRRAALSVRKREIVLPRLKCDATTAVALHGLFIGCKHRGARDQPRLGVDYRCPEGRQLHGVYRDCRDRGPTIAARCRCTGCRGSTIDAVRIPAIGKVRACPDCYARYELSLKSALPIEAPDR